MRKVFTKICAWLDFSPICFSHWNTEISKWRRILNDARIRCFNASLSDVYWCSIKCPFKIIWTWSVFVGEMILWLAVLQCLKYTERATTLSYLIRLKTNYKSFSNVKLHHQIKRQLKRQHFCKQFAVHKQCMHSTRINSVIVFSHKLMLLLCIKHWISY